MVGAGRAHHTGSRIALIFLILSVACLKGPGAGYCEACPVAPASGRQPYPEEAYFQFLRAGLNRLGGTGPTLPRMYSGYPPAYGASPYIPCILLMAIGQTESGGWKQFVAAYGGTGPTLISSDCGYGIMQVTSGMDGKGGFDPGRVASEYIYNLGTGAKILIEKWNAYPYFVGGNAPKVAEDWYYAVWAYNGWVNKNNPDYNCPLDNHDCGWANNPFRPPFDPYDPTLSRRWYPYQELVWGYAAHPPQPGGRSFWPAVPLSLPPPGAVGVPPTTILSRPLPSHLSCKGFTFPSVFRSAGGG